MPEASRLGDVAALARVNRVEVADPLAVFRVLAVRDEEAVVEDHGGGDHVVPGARPDGVLRIGVEPPERLPGLCRVTPDPAVTLAHDDLGHSPHLGDAGGGPLPVQEVLPDVVRLPDEFSGPLVHRDDRGGERRGRVDVGLVVPVRGVHEQQVAVGDRVRVRHVVREGAEFLHHVEPPDDVPVGRGLAGFVGHRSVVAVRHPLDIHRQQLAPVRHVVEAVPLHQRRGADPLVGPVVHPAGDELVRDHLPEELSGRGVEGEQDPLVAHGFLVVERLVVGADEDPAAGDHRIAVGLGAERRDPADVVSAVHVPRGREPRGGVRNHVPVGRPAPHRPVLGTGGPSADQQAREQPEGRQSTEGRKRRISTANRSRNHDGTGV